MNIISEFVIKFIVFLSFSRLIFAQNDDQKYVVWGENDPRWEKKIPNWWDEENFVSPVGPEAERSKEFWIDQGQNFLNRKIHQKLNTNKAKNLVIFIGDGMGLPTLMATRSYMNDVNTELSFEKFAHTGLAKTYCINYQVPDSACTASAILTGTKSNYGTISVTGNVNLRNCTAQQDEANQSYSIFKYAQEAGKATGVVTTTRVTHATPAASYARSASRYWESNENTPEDCKDIAHQLVHGEIGSNLDVIMGGGRRHFLSNVGNVGVRTDGRDLLDEYSKMQASLKKRAIIVQNKTELASLDVSSIDRVLGIFAQSHLEYSLLSDVENQPTLTEMTSKALEVLKKNGNGFVLLVEGGRIDTAHHETTARLALDEAKEFQGAVEYVKNNTDEDETLIVVTADHSTVLSVGGYMPRGYNILGPGDFSRVDQMWFYSLSYASGPGHFDHVNPNGGRQNPKGKNYMDPKFRQPTTIPEDEQTHAAEDVGVYANGPFSHIFSGVYEQSYIAHAMAYATCLGPDTFFKNPQCTDGASVVVSSFLLSIIALLTIAVNRNHVRI